ncbi:hypothetical protein [Hymenobacter persicinus]|uniref:Uncharacterized protein n=1 Tax=Hymenobacter persicinus TaxID=2025506 RepID=A0A4Q5LE26_9BACT|nr:hypothetical protein [Hymenobacter persicinus]RYU82186.1 hypothetical protein EWM57_05235 [Hymenobacter persicinus]
MISLLRGGLLAALVGVASCPSARAQLFYTVKLSAESAWATNPRPVYVAQVVDARLTRSGLGWLSSGAENMRRLARFPQGLEHELTHFYGQVPRSPQALPLVLVVRRLSLAEQAANLQEVAQAEVVADFYYQHADGYHRVYHAAELTTDQAFDVTGRHDSNISRALLMALPPMATLSSEQAAAGPALTWAQVLHAPAPEPYPVQTAAKLHPGVYRTVADFQQNTPLAGVEWEAKEGVMFGTRAIVGTQPTGLKLRGDTPTGQWHDGRDYWGFCDGRQQYVRYGGAFYPLQRTAAGYEYQAPVYIDPRQQSQTMLYTPAGTLALQKPWWTAATLQLWPDTGFSSEKLPLTERADAPAAVATVVVYRRPDAAPDRPVQVSLNGQVMGTLRGGEYLTLPMPAGAPAEISVCGQAEREACFRFRPDLRAANYLDCHLGTATQPAPSVRLVSVDIGAAALQECAEAK